MSETVKVPDEAWRVLIKKWSGRSIHAHIEEFTGDIFREMEARGWLMVPVEATEEMISRALIDFVRKGMADTDQRPDGWDRRDRSEYREVWASMLTAAPKLDV